MRQIIGKTAIYRELHGLFANKLVRRLSVGLTLTLLLVTTTAYAQDGPSFDFQAELNRIADKCAELDLEQQELATRKWYIPRDARRHYLFVSDPPRISISTNSQLEQLWLQYFTNARKQQADQLFAQSQSKAATDPAAAFRLLHEVLRENPDHAEARRILGFRRSGERWTRPRTLARPRVGTSAHPEFGWRRGKYWVIETDHFRITTNHSIRQGNELGEKLERLYDAWRQLFFRFWAEPDRLATRFGGRNVALADTPRFNVVLFNNRQEYVNQLGRDEPQIQVTVGYYSQKKRRSFFFAGEGANDSTWYHEATHQFFHETADGIEDVGGKQNFWIVEGLALYMESLRPFDGYATVGGFDANRLQFARYRALSQQFYIPMEQFAALGREQMQQNDDIRRLYSQAAGLTHYLMDAGDREQSAAVVDFVVRTYAGRDQLDSLARVLDCSFEDINRDYIQFLASADAAQLQHVGPAEFVVNLNLGRTQVTPESLSGLSDMDELQWLDLTGIQANDEQLSWVTNNRNLRQLTVENTLVTDNFVKSLVPLRRLEELDLSGTQITDGCLRDVGRLTNLKVLYLTNTQVSDQGLVLLRGLKNLELLEVSNTQVSDAALKDLKSRLPDLK